MPSPRGAPTRASSSHRRTGRAWTAGPIARACWPSWCRAAMRWPGAPMHRFDALLDHDIVGLHAGAAAQEQMRERAQALGRTLNARMQVHGFDAIAQLVEAGLGVAVLPAVVAERFAKVFRVQPLKLNEDWAQRRYLLAVRRQAGAAAIAAALCRRAVSIQAAAALRPRRPRLARERHEPRRPQRIGSNSHPHQPRHRHDRPHAVRQALGRPRRPHRGRRHRRPLHRPPPGARGDQPAGLRRAAPGRAQGLAHRARWWPRPTTTRPPPAGRRATTASPIRSASCRSTTLDANIKAHRRGSVLSVPRQAPGHRARDRARSRAPRCPA